MNGEKLLLMVSRSVLQDLLDENAQGISSPRANRDLLFCEMLNLMSRFSDTSLNKLVRRMSNLVERRINAAVPSTLPQAQA